MPDLISLLCIVTGSVEVVYTLALMLLVLTIHVLFIATVLLQAQLSYIKTKFIVDMNLIVGTQPLYSP